MRNLKGKYLFLFFAVSTVLILLAVGQFAQKTPVIAAGKIILHKSKMAEAEKIRTLFITLFDAERPIPMPYAAARFQLTSQPHEGEFFHFVLTHQNIQVMNPNRPNPHKIRIKVRLDADGQAGPDQQGDLTGELPSVAVGSENLTLEII